MRALSPLVKQTAAREGRNPSTGKAIKPHILPRSGMNGVVSFQCPMGFPEFFGIAHELQQLH